MSKSSFDYAEGRVQVVVTGPIARLTFNQPARMNAMSLDMWQGLWDGLVRLEQDANVRVLVLAGAGDKAFVSGADISEFDRLRATPDGVEAYNRISEGAERALYHFPKPTIAELKGPAIGGGLALAIACDFRVAAEDTKLGIPAAKLGLAYGYDGVAKLVALAGPEVTARLLFSAQFFSADEALAMGLLTKVVARADLTNEVVSFAAQLSSRAPMTQAAAKAAIRAVTGVAGAVDRETIDAMVAACYASADYAEGRAAFAEKRAPVFRNH